MYYNVNSIINAFESPSFLGILIPPSWSLFRHAIDYIFLLTLYIYISYDPSSALYICMVILVASPCHTDNHSLNIVGIYALSTLGAMGCLLFSILEPVIATCVFISSSLNGFVSASARLHLVSTFSITTSPLYTFSCSHS